MSDLLKALLDFKNRAVKWWGGLSQKQKSAVGVGIGIFGLSIFVGGVFAQAAVGAGVVVGLLGMEFHDSPAVSRFMVKYGKTLDLTLTAIGVIAGPGGGVTAVLFGFLMGGFFTILRLVLWPEEVKKPAVVTIHFTQKVVAI